MNRPLGSQHRAPPWRDAAHQDDYLTNNAPDFSV